MVSPRLLLAACTLALALPSAASAGLFGCHTEASCAAPCGEVYCEPTCAAPCGDVCCEPTCAAPCAPTCAAPCGDVCASSCDSYYCCPPQESCCKRFVRKLWNLEQRKNAWLLSKFSCLGGNDCAPAYGCCEPTCAAPCGEAYCAPTCAAPCGDVCCEPSCAAPCEPTCAAPVYCTPSCGAPSHSCFGH